MKFFSSLSALLVLEAFGLETRHLQLDDMSVDPIAVADSPLPAAIELPRNVTSFGNTTVGVESLPLPDIPIEDSAMTIIPPETNPLPLTKSPLSTLLPETLPPGVSPPSLLSEIVVTGAPSPRPTEIVVTGAPSPSPATEIVVTGSPSPSPTELVVTGAPFPSPTEIVVTGAPSARPTEIVVTGVPSPSPTELVVTGAPSTHPTEIVVTGAPSQRPTEIVVTGAPSPSPTESVVTGAPSPRPTEIVVTPSLAPADPEWFTYNLTEFTNVTNSTKNIKRCKKRKNIPPKAGTPCSRKPKVCYFGEQKCDGESRPAVRFECRAGTDGRNVWFEVELTCNDSCFSGETIVELKGGRSVQMKDLRLGDIVETGEGRFTRVYSFGHFNTEVQTTYLQLYTNQSLYMPVEISPDHMIFVGKAAVPAGSVKVGDTLRLSNGEPAAVVEIKPVIRVGAYAPFTVSGSIVVNGIVASNYISFESQSGDLSIGDLKVASYQWVAHLSQAPHRLYCTLASKCEKESYNDDGVSMWVAMPLRAARWWHDQIPAVKVLAATPVLAFLLFIYATEILLKHPWTIALVVAIAFHKKRVLAKM